MRSANEGQPAPKRRRYSREFKASIIAACQDPDTSIAQVARHHDLNANQVQNWIAQARKQGCKPDPPDFVPLLPAVSKPQEPWLQKGSVIRIEYPARNGVMVIEWPSDQAHECIALLRGLLT